MVQIVPSIFASDFTRLGDDVERVLAGGATMLHVDVMDGHFVPNFTVGTPITEALHKRFGNRVKLDHHLMIEDPDTYAPLFIEAGAYSVSVHYEVCRNLDRTLHSIRERGAKAGVVINPHTPVRLLENVLDIVDYVLVMSVNPGYGGQKFIPNTIRKIRELSRWRDELGLQFKIEVDGGVGKSNVVELARAGVDWFVAGTSVFHAPDPAEAVRELRGAAEEAISLKV